MNLYYYTKHQHSIFNSLNRFCNYIFNIQLCSLPIKYKAIKDTTLFASTDEKDENELINFIVENEEIYVVTIGFDDNSSINILDFSNLKKSLKKILDGNLEDVKPLFTVDELKEKLQNFFHSHGEDSLFEYLNWTIYYLREGPILFVTKDISYDDYQEKFLEIGFKNWNLFKNRYLKYKNLIKLSNFILAFDNLDNTINDVDNYVNWLKKLSKQEILKKNKKYFCENIDKLIKIVELLTEFYKEFQLGKFRVQNTFS